MGKIHMRGGGGGRRNIYFMPRKKCSKVIQSQALYSQQKVSKRHPITSISSKQTADESIQKTRVSGGVAASYEKRLVL
jgi:hypothetical protein